MGLFYREIGEGVPVVILHGLYGSSDNWMPIARKLSEQYKVLSVDLRNHGASPHFSTHTYPEMVTDLAWLFHELNIEKAHLMGHSMGGKTAIQFAADYPEKVLSLTIADIAPKNYLENPASVLQYDFHKRLLTTLFELDLSTMHTRKEVDEALQSKIPEVLVRQFILKNLYSERSNLKWKINVHVLLKELNHIIGAVGWEEFADRIPILLYPVLFIKGSLSGYIDEGDEQLIKKMYPDAKIVTIPDATHLLHAEKPEEFAEVFLKFVKNRS